MNIRLLRSRDDGLLVERDGRACPLADAWPLADLPDSAPRSAIEFIERGLFGAAVLEDLLARWEGAGHVFIDPPDVLLPPIRPVKILALGRNYAAHAREMGSAPAKPFFFGKLPSCCTGHGEPIVIPDDLEGEVHHEVELAVIIGRPGRRIAVERAMEHVAGYAVLNDVTARTVQDRAKEKGHPWTSGKNVDTFAPLGPGLVPADAIEDPGALSIRLRVNGEVRQDGSTRDMILPIPETLAHLSTHLTLETGDLIATGTPAGVGTLVPGDVVEAEVEGVGWLINPVRAESD
jgi:2-keto-4-pentenoate hydratase/2-oxohepta-3-ene-1,7-dioic acid hydratase in catechol pathway